MSYLEILYKRYPQIVRTSDGLAFDANNNIVTYDEAAIQAELDALAYITQRAAEYPPLTDYLDGVVKGDQAQIDAYIAACLAVKAKYPKSE